MAEMPREIMECDSPERAAEIMRGWKTPEPTGVRVVHGAGPGTPPAYVSQAPHSRFVDPGLTAVRDELRELKDAILRLVEYLERQP